MAWSEPVTGSEQRPDVAAFHHEATGSVQYVVACPATRRCAIVDPVLDYDAASAGVGTTEAERLLAHVHARGLQVEWILDTHPHADHLSAAAWLAARTGAPTGIGTGIVGVQRLWAGLYNTPDLACDGSQWARLFADGERFRIGALEAEAMLHPGHTMCSVTYRVGDAAFVHDTLFMPDVGTARTDFPGGDAAALWRSIQGILALPEGTRLFTGHDYRPGGRPAAWQSAAADQRAGNPWLRPDLDQAGFVAKRMARDRTLPMPGLILHAMQVNIRGGRLPDPEGNGRRYLRIPLDLFQTPPPDASNE